MARPDEGDSRLYRQSFGVVPEYGSNGNSLVFDPDLAEKAIRFSDPGLLAHFRSLGDQRLAGEGPVTVRLRRLLGTKIQGRLWRTEALARALGFAEQSAFQAWFKRRAGVTPLQFRRGRP